MWHMVRSVLGIEAFGINAWTATEDGQELIVEHDEVGTGAGRHEELYIVVTGRPSSRSTERRSPLLPETSSTSRFHKRSAARRDEAGTTVLVVGGKRGEAFEVSSWERSAEALRFWPTEEWERAIAILQREHVEHPENGGVLYNLACAEGSAAAPTMPSNTFGSRSSSSPAFSKNVGGDSDLVSLREDERFPGSPLP